MHILDAIGLAGPSFEVPIERGKIIELARASGSHLPAYLQDPAPVVTPNYLASVGHLWGYTFEVPGDTPFAQVEVDRTFLLHGSEECEFFGPPPRAGTRLTAQVRISDVQIKQGRRGGQLTFITEERTFEDEHGTPVAITRSTYIYAEDVPDND